MERWSGKVAVVIGACEGIGAAVTIELVKAGMTVVGLSKHKARIDDLRELIPNGARGKLHAVKCDVFNDMDVGRTFGWIFAEVGVIQVLVNNWGMLSLMTITDEGNEDELKAAMHANLWASVMCTKKAVDVMKRQLVPEAHIININCVYRHAVPECSAHMYLYPVSKFGVAALTEVLRHSFRFDHLGYKVTVFFIAFI